MGFNLVRREAPGTSSASVVTGRRILSSHAKTLRSPYTLENQITRAEVLKRAELTRVFAAISDAFASRVMSVQRLSRQEKEDLLKDLATWPLALEEVAHAQSRLPHKNGEAPEQDGSED